MLRHAKAAAESPDGTDHTRALTEQGRAQAAAAAEFLEAARAEDAARVPRLVLCSSAVRAVQTAELVLPALGTEVAFEIEEDLYQADAEDVVERLRTITEPVDSVMVVGHNPAFAEVVQLLVSDDDAGATKKLEFFPTCAIAEIVVPAASWQDLEERTGRLERLFHP